jgi:hypothetical protein
MKTKNIRSRLDDLERGNKSHGMILVFRRDDETREQAIERKIAEGKFTEEDRADRPIVVLDEDDARL